MGENEKENLRTILWISAGRPPMQALPARNRCGRFRLVFASRSRLVKRAQAACKPGSVPGTNAGGWPFLWDPCHHEPRATDPDDRPGNRPALSTLAGDGAVVPTWSCSRWGLPCHRRCRRRGAPLPHPFTLTRRHGRSHAQASGLLSVALSLGSPPPGVTRHRVPVEPGLSSPTREGGSGHPAACTDA